MFSKSSSFFFMKKKQSEFIVLIDEHHESCAQQVQTFVSESTNSSFVALRKELNCWFSTFLKFQIEGWTLRILRNGNAIKYEEGWRNYVRAYKCSVCSKRQVGFKSTFIISPRSKCHASPSLSPSQLPSCTSIFYHDNP